MTDTKLEQWIAEHRVCFEVSPHFEVHRHEKLHVGFELTLFARPLTRAIADPGGDEAHRIFEGLREVLAAVMPAGVDYAVLPFDVSFHLRTTSSWRPEVQLVAEILHGSTFAPVDDEERGYARAVRQALLRLGVAEGIWAEVAVGVH